jgi:hypothetical protein
MLNAKGDVMVHARPKRKPSVLKQRPFKDETKRYNVGKLSVGEGNLKQIFVVRYKGKLPEWGSKQFMKKVEFFLLLSKNIPLLQDKGAQRHLILGKSR